MFHFSSVVSGGRVSLERRICRCAQNSLHLSLSHLRGGRGGIGGYYSSKWNNIVLVGKKIFTWSWSSFKLSSNFGEKGEGETSSRLPVADSPFAVA